MQATLNIDDNLFEEAVKIVASRDQNKVIETALREFINNHKTSKKNNILDLYGAGGISEDYDYKALRNDGGNHLLFKSLKITSLQGMLSFVPADFLSKT